jgi:dUTP pyrophosphatase
MNSKKKNNRIPVKIIADSPEFIPQYKTAGAAAADVVANIPPNDAGHRTVLVMPNQIEIIDVGFSVEIPECWEIQIRGRSGLACRGLQVTNSPGTIDSDFRNRIKVIVNNCSKNIITITHGDRIAQMLIKPVYKFDWIEASELNQTERGLGGLGSTGK